MTLPDAGEAAGEVAGAPVAAGLEAGCEVAGEEEAGAGVLEHAGSATRVTRTNKQRKKKNLDTFR